MHGWDAVAGEMTRRDALRRFGMGGMLLTAPALLQACEFGSGDDAASTRGASGRRTNEPIAEITWGLVGAVPSVDVATGFTIAGVTAIAPAFEGLVALRPDLSLEPLLAASYSKPDPLRYVYEIREGVKFWDGTPMTVEDVAFSLDRHRDPKTGSQAGSFFSNVAAVKVTGPRHVTVHMSKPDPLFEYVPVFIYVIPKALATKLGKKYGVVGPAVNAMGTGPLRITSFDDTAVTMERNPHYWGEPSRVRKLAVRTFAAVEPLRLAFQSGDVQGTMNVPVESLKEWERMSGVRLEASAPLRASWLCLNVERPPFDDLHVRRAIGHAVDREGYVEAFLGRLGAVPLSTVPTGMWANLADEATVSEIYDRIPQYEFSVDKAKAELARSAHPDGFAATVEYQNSRAVYGKVLVSLSETLKELGIDLRVKGVNDDKFYADLYGNDQAIIASGYSPDYPDPADVPVLIYPTSAAVPNAFNTAHFKDPKVDRLLEQQARTTDKAKRAELLGQVLEISNEQLPYVPLWWQGEALVVSDRYVYDGFTSFWYCRNWLQGLSVAA